MYQTNDKSYYDRQHQLMPTVCLQRISKALFIRPLRWKHDVHSLPTCYVFHNPDINCYFPGQRKKVCSTALV